MDADLRSMIQQMFDLMYEANGIGLAANQVDLPLRFFICNLAAEPNQGQELVFLNPVLSRPKGQTEREEGCLSLPGLYAPVRRPETVHLEAYGLDGSPISLDLDDLMARVVQHEIDHLDGVLFTDRLSPTVEMDIRPALEEFELVFASRRNCGEIPSDAAIAERLAELEKKYAIIG
jgi:peptide deformylase